MYTSSRIVALSFLIQLVGDCKENYHCMCLCNSVLDMLKHKFTHYTNTKLRTVIKCVHKMGFLLSHLIQLLLFCSVLLLNLAQFVSKKCSALLSYFYCRQACWGWQGLRYAPPVTLCLCQEVGLQAQPLH